MKVALVLGAGGVTGGAFHAGVLAALHDELGWDARRADVVIGTSAGSMAGAALRAGLSPRDLYARATGRPLSVEGARLVRSMPPPPSHFPLRREVRARAGRRPAAAANLGRMALSRASIGAMAAALLPRGEIPIADLAAGFDPLFRDAWPRDPLWVCAVRLTDGRRVVFGREGHPKAPVAQAVASSCAIPGYFSPVAIDGVDHVDGGVHSPTNLDLVAGLGYDLVVVSSPMSIAGRGIRVAADTALRRACRAFLDREAIAVRRRGTPVVAFQPTPDDASVMGVNAMDPSRRSEVARRIYDSTKQRLARADMGERLRALQVTSG
ncbi:MAG TPA: patatin-like phospholipase family protein [Acidimicrobiales bacterium]|nr:patatin-like phospholipase family protein [Acidimicrobiales bacterium]